MGQQINSFFGFFLLESRDGNNSITTTNKKEQSEYLTIHIVKQTQDKWKPTKQKTSNAQLLDSNSKVNISFNHQQISLISTLSLDFLVWLIYCYLYRRISIKCWTGGYGWPVIFCLIHNLLLTLAWQMQNTQLPVVSKT